MELRGQELNMITLSRFWFSDEYGIKKSKQSDKKIRKIRTGWSKKIASEIGNES